MWPVLCAIILCLIAYRIYKLGNKNEGHFESRGIKCLSPKFFFGNMKDVYFRRKSLHEVALEFYNAFPNEKVMGVYDLRAPVILIRDPEIVKRVLITEFDHFPNHNFIISESMDVLFGNTLFQMKSQQWKDMRSALSPVFTSSKLRIMFDLFLTVGDKATTFADQLIGSKSIHNFELKDFFSRCTADVMAEYSYGIEMNSHEKRRNEFFLAGESIREFGGPLIMFKVMLNKLFPFLYRKLNLSMFDAQLMKFFRYLVHTTFDHRTKNNIRRPDLLQNLMEMKQNPKSGSNQWTDDQLISQSFVFFIGGFDTLSTLLSFTCYELARNPVVQEKAYQEALELAASLGDRKLTYDDTAQMKYLSMVIQEVLRLWPIVPSTDRACTKDYLLKDEETGLEYTVKKGSTIWIPILGIQMDPKYYPEPMLFNPDRFGEEMNNGEAQSVPLLSFGLGPRSCIGNRFALLVAKALIHQMLIKYEMVVTEETQVPIKTVPSLIGLTTEKGVTIGLKRR